MVWVDREGAFIKVYNVEMLGEPLVMRVSLLIDPQYKTLVEVVTIAWIHYLSSCIVLYSVRDETRAYPILESNRAELHR